MRKMGTEKTWIRDGSQTREADPDCGTCVLRKGCPSAAEGSFCTRWRSKEPEKREPDPNRAWETGEEADL